MLQQNDIKQKSNFSLKLIATYIGEKTKPMFNKIKKGIIIRKFNELGILLKSFGIALLDIFRTQKRDDAYVSLAPIKNADKDGTYCNALKYAIDSNEIKNIAITGNYGSGKSSVIKTFFEKLENKKYNPIYVSLAAFNKNDYIESINTQTTGEGKVKEIQVKNEFYHTLEKSILQQLLYQASENEVPLSRFKRISKHSKILLNAASVGIIVAICILIFIIYPGAIDSIINNYNIVKIKLTEQYTNILISVLIIAIYIITYKLLFFLSTKVNISRFKIKDAEVEIDNKPESIFNRYLDEIMYFFQVTNHKVVIIEDLDRYEGNASFIFQKLRELNTLINASNQVEYEVDFIYAIKDDFFEDYEERTKFFDYIIPIIPISSRGNSNEIIWKRLEKLKVENGLSYKFDKKFIDDVAVLIEDKRLIDNIINEFIIYKNKMHNKYMDDKQLFAIIMYKNIYPAKYSELQRNKGTIVDIFSNKKTIVKELTKELYEQINNLNEKKILIKNEALNSVQELKYTLVSSIYKYSNDYYAHYEKIFKFDNEKVDINNFFSSTVNYNKIKDSYVKFTTPSGSYINKEEKEVFQHFGNKTMFLQRWENIEKGKQIRLMELQKEIEKIDSEILNINKLSLKKLVNKYNLTTIFDNAELIEKFFITKGYITEEYRDYITLFVPGNLTKEDNEFVCAVKTGEQLPYDFKLTNIENILKRLNESDYENKSILNFDLLEYLIRNNYKKECLKIVDIINEENDYILKFVDEFIEKYKLQDFVELLIENANKIWKKIYTKIGNQEYIDKWVIRYLTNENSLKNVDENFKEYVETHINIDKLISEQQIDSVINSIKQLDIKFKNIQEINNKKFIEQIYIYELYELNSTMIKLMLTLKDVKKQEFEEKNLTIIFNEEKIKELKEYVINNFKEYYNLCYTLNTSNEDSEKNILEVINDESIDLDIKKQIIVNEKFSNYNIEGIDKELINVIIKEDKLKVSYENIILYFKMEDKLCENIINNISLHIKEYIKEDINKYKEKYGEDILEKLKMEYIFNEKVSFEDFKLLVKTLNIRIKELKECPSIKLEFLIDQNLIEFNLNNFEYIRENLESKLVKFITLNIDAYIENINEYDISGYEEQLLSNTEINNENKKHIANSIDISKLKNINIIELIMQEIIDADDKEINNRILNDLDINFETKIKFIKIILQKTTDKEVATEYIHLLGEEYANINTSKNGCSIEYNTLNIELCDILKEKGYISSFKKGKKKNIVIYNKVNR